MKPQTRSPVLGVGFFCSTVLISSVLAFWAVTKSERALSV